MGAGTGAHHHRLALTVSASDPLPTAAVIERAKADAWDCACRVAGSTAWPPGPQALAIVGAAPLLALAVLVELCPEVQAARLARCLGLDPLAAPTALQTARRGPGWLPHYAAVIADVIREAHR